MSANGHKRKNNSQNSKMNKKKRFTREENLLEEQRLEQLVLGSNILGNVAANPFQEGSIKDENTDSGVDIIDEEPTTSRTAAWIDEDDEHLCVKDLNELNQKKIHATNNEASYSSLLRQKYIKLNGNPKWAELDMKVKSNDSEDDDSEDELLQRCSNLLSTKQTILRKETLDTRMLPDINLQTRKEGPIITSVEFHPKSSVGLVAGFSGLASIFQVDGESNPKLQSILFERFPISCSRFTPDGNSFIVGSKDNSYFYMHNLIEGKSHRMNINNNLDVTNTKLFEISPGGNFIALAGRYGNIYILNTLNNETIASFKMNGEVGALTFSEDGSRLYSYNNAGEVYIWDMTNRTCRCRFQDEGSLRGGAIALSPNGQYLACGSYQGIVNLYTPENLIENIRFPKPFHTLYNLTTPITHLRFNHTSEILAMTSSYKDSAVKLAHFPSMTVFKNFPKISNLPKLGPVAFSPNSGFLALGSNVNRARLFRLKHYGNY